METTIFVVIGVVGLVVGIYVLHQGFKEAKERLDKIEKELEDEINYWEQINTPKNKQHGIFCNLCRWARPIS